MWPDVLTTTMGPTLRDIHLPAEPSWWPPAPGWWLLVAILVLVLYWLQGRLRTMLQRRLRTRGLRAAHRRMAALAGDAEPPVAVAAVSEFLRRAVRTRQPEAAVLTGDAWIDYLNSTGGNAFNAESAALLREGGYRARVEGDINALIEASDQWLAHWMRGAGNA